MPPEPENQQPITPHPSNQAPVRDLGPALDLNKNDAIIQAARAYPKSVHIIFFVSGILAAFVPYNLTSYYEAGGISHIFTVPLLFCALGAYVFQLHFFHTVLRMTALVKTQGIFIACAIAATVCGAIIGDIHGVKKFGGESSVGLGGALYVAIGTLLPLVGAFYIGNVFRLWKPLSHALGILGKVLLVLIGLLIAVISFAIYSIIYTMHDPSTE